MAMDIRYRKATGSMPSAVSIDGEPVAAEISDLGNDLAALIITANDERLFAFKIWRAWASDLPGVTEFIDVEVLHTPTYKSLSAALDSVSAYLQGVGY